MNKNRKEDGLLEMPIVFMMLRNYEALFDLIAHVRQNACNLNVRRLRHNGLMIAI